MSYSRRHCYSSRDKAPLQTSVVVVDVPEDLQLTRTMSRDDNDESLVKRIMAAQLDRETRLARADTSIANDASLEALYRRVEALHQDLLARAAAVSETKAGT